MDRTAAKRRMLVRNLAAALNTRGRGMIGGLDDMVKPRRKSRSKSRAKSRSNTPVRRKSATRRKSSTRRKSVRRKSVRR
jgi:hypothetical protein